MARPDKEQALVNAILDAEIASDKISDDAKAEGKTLAQKLTGLARKLVTLTRAGVITEAQAKGFFIEGYRALALLGFTRVAQDVKDHGDQFVDKIAKAAQALGPDVTKMDIIRKLEKEQRKVEQADGG